MGIYEYINKISKELHKDTVDFAKRLLKVPALSGSLH